MVNDKAYDNLDANLTSLALMWNHFERSANLIGVQSVYDPWRMTRVQTEKWIGNPFLPILKTDLLRETVLVERFIQVNEA